MEKPECKSSETDGNVFGVIGAVSSVLRKAGMREDAAKFRREALALHSYDEILQLTHKYVEWI